MKSIILLFDPEMVDEVDTHIVPRFGADLKLKLPFTKELTVELGKEDFVVTYLSDDQLKELFPLALEQEWRIALLPHPDFIQGRQGFGVEDNLDECLDQVLEAEETERVDLLMLNDRPVFNSVVIGESLSLTSGSLANNGWKRFWKKVNYFIKLFWVAKSHPYCLEAYEKEKLDTAAIGMVIVQHGESNLLSRKVLENSYINDGKLHAMVLSPKSISGLWWFGLDSFFRREGKNTLPPFAAHIKTSFLRITSEESINYSLDGNLLTAKCLELVIKPKALKMLPGKHLDLERQGSDEDIFKVRVLPRGEVRDELLKRKLPLINHASTEEFKELFSNLRSSSRTSSSYLVLMVLSTLIATLGLFGNSSPVIIGAMILAPLMAPIISLAMGVLRQDKNLIINSSKAIGWGMLLGYLCAMFITWLTPSIYQTKRYWPGSGPIYWTWG